MSQNQAVAAGQVVSSEAKFPPQIKYIVGQEAAERFSYYGMRSILVMFMISQLTMTGPEAKSVYHLFVSACYLLPLLGGYLADRWLGKYHTIIYLSLVYCLGHLTLAIWENQTGLYVGLALIAFGAGGIKPCVSAHVGDQFTEKNSRLLPRVFDLFYFSINFGSFFSTLLIPVLLKNYGPSVAFGIPGVLMAIATLVFWIGRRHYIFVPPTSGKDGAAGFLPVAFTAITHQSKRKPGQSFMDAALTRYSAEEVDAAKAAMDIFKVFITVSVFWALFDQHGSSWVLQAKDMDLNILGLTLDPSQIQAANPILVMILIPVFAGFIYPRIEKLGIKVTPLRKMSAGMFVAALSFVIVGIAQSWMDAGYTVSVGWQLLAFVVLTASEVMISITGLEFAYTQAPRAMKSTIMSFWFLTVFAGNLITAYVAAINKFTGAGEFFFFAALMGAVSIIFAWSASRYRVRNFVEKAADHGLASQPA
jgi:proton-dependent oligopeptide transporter, POT family